MGFPESVLTEGEQVDMHLHPHWKVMVRPYAIGLILIAAVVVAAIFLPSGSAGSIGLLAIGAVALVLFCILTVWPWLKWRTTHYVFTSHRVIMREGVFAREGRDIPLNRVNDVSFHHNMVERMLRCGTLVIESAGERGQVTLTDIPRVEKVQSRLYALVEADHEAHTFDEGDRDAIARQIARETDITRDNAAQ